MTIEFAEDDPSHRAWKSGASPIPGLPVQAPAFFRSVEILLHSTPEVPRKVAVSDLSFEFGGE
ncbi:MAG: hypothetical protein ACQKBT_00315 [Puniceicoccales bacterium]